MNQYPGESSEMSFCAFPFKSKEQLLKGSLLNSLTQQKGMQSAGLGEQVECVEIG